MPDRVAAIKDVPAPDSKVALQLYLGMINYYRRFMPRLANRLAPFHRAVVAAGKPKVIIWTDQCDEAFRASKDAKYFRHFLEEAELSVATTPPTHEPCAMIGFTLGP